MKLTSQLSLLVFGVIFFLFNSCSDKSNDIAPSPVNLNPEGTNLSAKSNLGRVLFYDSHLSENAAVACASCHKQSLAFSDNVSFSRGFENKPSLRNSLPIQNISFSAPLFWDGRETYLPSMVLKPILNHVEMGMSNEDALVSRVANLPYYADLFNKAFGTTNITGDEIGSALASFVEIVSSFNTHFDHNSFSALETQGKDLFFGKYNCGGCHRLTTYGSNQEFINIGLDVNYTDKGVGGITHNSGDDGKFKVPNLRNVTLTAPYMHDGRFATLDAVLEHYSHGINDNSNLDARLKTTDGKPLRMNITDNDKKALIAFLGALTDYTLITNADYSSPFKIQ